MMDKPTVSVIIPAFRGGDLLSEAIKSVLAQTFSEFELIIVDDCPDHPVRDVVEQFHDGRIRYVLHDQNLGAMTARKTGIRKSQGEIIALLDQDDLFHPEKLMAHVEFLAENFEVGVTYNDRFECEYPSDQVVGIWQPPVTADLSDLLVGFPFAPSDIVLRRNWAVLDDIWDDTWQLKGETAIFNGGEYIIYGRLALSGCKFSSVKRALNYRRFQRGRFFGDLALRCQTELVCQELVFSDTRCPFEVQKLRNRALANTLLDYSFLALAQGEVDQGKSFLAKAIRLDPTGLEGLPPRIVTNFISKSGMGFRDPESTLSVFFENLPPPLVSFSSYWNWALGRAQLIRGSREAVWGRIDTAEFHLRRASEFGLRIDDDFLNTVVHQLIGYQRELGQVFADAALARLRQCLSKIAEDGVVNRLEALYSFNQAFDCYRSGNWRQTVVRALQAMARNPKYCFDRGLVAMSVRSCARIFDLKTHGNSRSR